MWCFSSFHCIGRENCPLLKVMPVDCWLESCKRVLKFFEVELSVRFVEQFISCLWVNILHFHFEDLSVNSV